MPLNFNASRRSTMFSIEAWRTMKRKGWVVGFSVLISTTVTMLITAFTDSSPIRTHIDLRILLRHMLFLFSSLQSLLHELSWPTKAIKTISAENCSTFSLSSLHSLSETCRRFAYIKRCVSVIAPIEVVVPNLAALKVSQVSTTSAKEPLF